MPDSTAERAAETGVSTGISTESSENRKSGRRHVVILMPSDTMILVGYEPPFDSPFTADDLSARSLALIDILEALRMDVQDHGIDLTGYDHNYLSELRASGLAAYNTLISDRFRGALVRASEDGTQSLSLTFQTSPRMSFLWELIYDGKRSGAVEPDHFWGFRYPIGRAFILEKVQYPPEIWPAQGIFSAIHEDLPFSRPEVMKLKEYLEQVKKSHPRLELKLRLLDDEFSSPLLSSDPLMERFISDDFRYGIIHFACHCDNPAESGAHTAKLFLKAHNQEFEMPYDALKVWLSDGTFVNQPLVFLNACESQTTGHRLESANFPEGFLRFHASGVIATACTIPDQFANAFATEFYRRLLRLDEEEADAGGTPLNAASSIGEALLDTRLHFLNKYNNPLGLAYGLYAVSNQKFRLRG